MLHDFITAQRAEILARCRAYVSNRPAPRPTDLELEHGIPTFLDQLALSLKRAGEPDPAFGANGAAYGHELLRHGFTISQIVHDYGGICQVLTELAIEQRIPILPAEFQMLNRCLDEAIAAAVTAYSALRERDQAERHGHVAHELRNLLNTATLAFDVLQSGTVGVAGSTGAVLRRSLLGLRALIDGELTDVRLAAQLLHHERIVVRDLVEDVETTAAMDAAARALRLAVSSVPSDVVVHADRAIVTSVLGNLLQNAFKFTRPAGQVTLRVHATSARVFFDVEDECGGLPPGSAEALFRPFEQRGTERSGLGLGLSVCRRGAHANDGEISVRDRPGAGCVFTLELPRVPAQAGDN
jgi:signal transduction histidine kinase